TRPRATAEATAGALRSRSWNRSSVAPLHHVPDYEGSGVEREDNGQQNRAQPESQRQISLACFQGNRGGHDARNAVDVAADYDHRADLAGGTAKPSQHDRDQ